MKTTKYKHEIKSVLDGLEGLRERFQGGERGGAIMGQISALMDTNKALLEKMNKKPVPSFANEEAYILSRISSEGYEACPYYNPCETDKEKLAFLYAAFSNEYAWAIERYGMRKALTDWLSGLPSSINIEFENYRIFNTLKEWGELDDSSSEGQIDSALLKWFPRMAMRIMTLWRKEGVA